MDEEMMEGAGGGGDMPHDESMPHDDPGAKEMGQGGMIHIPKDMLPPGMSEKIKKGDILEFRCVGPADAEGDIPVEYNTGESDEKKDSWEDSFRAEMSPRSTAGDEGASDGGGAGQGY